MINRIFTGTYFLDLP